MIKKAIQDLQDLIVRKKLELHQADIGVTFSYDEDGDFFAASFENRQFNKMKIFGLAYKDAPQQLRRYYDEEHVLIHVPTEKVVEHLGPKTVKAWVRSQYSFCDYQML